LQTLKTSPLQYLQGIRCRSVRDVIAVIDSSSTVSLAKYRAVEGETKALALTTLLLTQVIENLNVGKTMSDTQVALAADIIADRYYYLTPEDFVVFARNALAGDYGQVYDRLDVQTLCGMLSKYAEQRFAEADRASYNQHNAAKGGTDLLSETILSNIKQRRNEHQQSNFDRERR
jgi:hypothetical protein